jgi:hypothetical protein
VPHYDLLLNPVTDEFGNVVMVSGDIYAKVTGNWQFSSKYLDETESGRKWYLDDGEYLDTSEEAFINSITTWKVGCQVSDVSDPAWSLASPVIIGTISSTAIEDDKITFEFTISKTTVQSGIRELGLYTNSDVLVAAATFPPIGKDGRVELRVIFEIYRRDLS